MKCFANKKIAFVGDSIARNQQQALQCTLLAGPEGESKKVNTNGYKIEYTSRYDDYNLEVIPELSGWKDYITPLNVYELSKYDLVVISTGSHWRRSSSGIDVSSKKSVFNAVQERILALSKLNVKTRIIWKGPDVNHWSQDVRYNPWNKPCANQEFCDREL